jgi:hypothetical protein
MQIFKYIAAHCSIIFVYLMMNLKLEILQSLENSQGRILFLSHSCLAVGSCSCPHDLEEHNAGMEEEREKERERWDH